MGEFALPLQSRALTVLLGVDEAEAERFIGWGVHVFHGENGADKGEELERYLNEQFDKAAAAPGDDFYGLLTRSFRGRPLTRAEQLGFANLMFAGGRDTMIHSVACAIGYLAEHPEALDFLRADPGRIVLASEEFFRVYMPLTHIGRVCPVDTDVHGMTVKAGDRASLCWASANLDETVFEAADEIQLDRRPNPARRLRLRRPPLPRCRPRPHGYADAARHALQTGRADRARLEGRSRRAHDRLRPAARLRVARRAVSPAAEDPSLATCIRGGRQFGRPRVLV